MRFSLRLTGLVAAPHTPMHADGSLHPERVADQAKLLQACQVRGAFICGTTGESLSLTIVERMQIADAWSDAAIPHMPIIVHVGSNCLPDARALAAHAAKCGASAIAVMAPSFFRPGSLVELIDYCAAIADAAPAVPLYYYDIPTMTNVPISTVRFLEEGSKRIPNLHGVKFTNSDLVGLQECLALEAFDVVFGYDEMLLAGLALGIRGAVGSTYNFAAPLYRRLFEAFDQGDLDTARMLQRQSVRMIRTLQSFGFSRASKALMKLIGVDCGPVRRPLVPMQDGELEELREQLRTLDGLCRPLAATGSGPRASANFG